MNLIKQKKKKTNVGCSWRLGQYHKRGPSYLYLTVDKYNNKKAGLIPSFSFTTKRTERTEKMERTEKIRNV